MPPRGGGGGGQQRQPAASLLALPDALLAEILLDVHQEDCFRNVSLVCKRLRQLCLAPEQLAGLDVRISGGRVLQRSRSALQFLTAHGSKVVELTFGIEPPAYPAPSTAEERELAALAVGCLTALGAAGAHLQRLHVLSATPLASTSWLPALTALTSLRIGHEQRALQLPEGLSQLRCLATANFKGTPLHLPATGLPASLTGLELMGATNAESLSQLSRLTKLQDLGLVRMVHAVTQFDSLATLPVLCSLRLHDATLPACLSQLTRLTCLVINGHAAEESDSINAALQHLTQLRMLALLSDTIESAPSAITALRSLQRLWFHSNADNFAPQLPHGPWLSSLHWLGVEWNVAAQAAADGRLAAAGQLQYLSLLSMPRRTAAGGAPIAGWDAFWAWAAGHPSLRCLGFDIVEDDQGAVQLEVLEALVRLKRRRPGLQWRCTGRESASFWTELLNRTEIPQDGN